MRKFILWIPLIWLLSACSLFGSGTGNNQQPDPKAITPSPSNSEDPFFESADDTALVIWKRSGGITGICQQLTIYPDGTYQIIECYTEEIIVEGTLEGTYQNRITDLTEMYATTEWQTPQIELGPDAFFDQLVLNGSGTLQADGKVLNEELALMVQVLMRNQ